MRKNPQGFALRYSNGKQGFPSCRGRRKSAAFTARNLVMRKNPQGFALRYSNGKQRLSVVPRAAQIREVDGGVNPPLRAHHQERRWRWPLRSTNRTRGVSSSVIPCFAAILCSAS